MLLPDIGFERDWVRAKIDSGVRFRLVLFALGDCSRVFTPTWDGLLSFIESECPACAEKARPHVDAMRQLSFAELVQLGNTVDKVPPEERDQVATFAAYAASEEDTLRHARAFLRHTIKCTPLFAGDGYTRTEAHELGAREYLAARCAVADLPGHRWVPLGK